MKSVTCANDELAVEYTIGRILSYIFHFYKALVCFTGGQLNIVLEQDLLAIAFTLDIHGAGAHLEGNQALNRNM